MSNHAVQMLPLSSLRLDEKSNVRKQGRGVDPVLLASISAIGLRVPLIVRKNGSGYVVVDGGQRLAALQAIAKTEKSDPDVPVISTDESDTGASEVSLALNIARTDMHPVDEYRAFTRLHTDKTNPQSVEDIAKRFGTDPKIVAQRLALGALDDSVLTAWVEQKIDARAVQAFTLQPDRKAQATALAKVLKGQYQPNSYSVKQALGIGNDDAGKYLDLVTEAAYVARGGKVTRDLFGADHQISDPALMTAMVNELIAAKVEALKAEGWAWVATEQPENYWNYQRPDLAGKPTKVETAELKRLADLCENEEISEEENDAASDAHDALQATIAARAITPEIKKKAGVLVTLSHTGKRIETDVRIAPKAEKPKAAAATDGKTKAKAKAPSEDNVSQALSVRLADQLTAATQATITSQPHVAMAALIASLASRSDTVGIHASMRGGMQKIVAFDATLQSALKLTTAKQIEVLTDHVSKALRMINAGGRVPALENADNKALAHAVDGKKLTAALREKFDAKDYFTNMSRAAIVDAVREAMGDDHASNVAKMDKAAAAKFAVANVPKTKWLPKQLRVAGYDGPATKKAAPKKTAAKSKR